jgi:hypothetical protein
VLLSLDGFYVSNTHNPCMLFLAAPMLCSVVSTASVLLQHVHGCCCNTLQLQGSCARVAEDACSKLPKKLGKAGRGGKGKGAARSSSAEGGSLGGLGVVLGATAALASVVVMAGLYRREVAGVVQVSNAQPGLSEEAVWGLGTAEVAPWQGMVDSLCMQDAALCAFHVF